MKLSKIIKPKKARVVVDKSHRSACQSGDGQEDSTGVMLGSCTSLLDSPCADSDEWDGIISAAIRNSVPERNRNSHTSP